MARRISCPTIWNDRLIDCNLNAKFSGHPRKTQRLLISLVAAALVGFDFYVVLIDGSTLRFLVKHYVNQGVIMGLLHSSPII